MDKSIFWASVWKEWSVPVPHSAERQHKDGFMASEAELLSQSIADILNEPEE